MATTKNLCAQIPIDLHERVSEERERLGQTTSEYITNLIQDYAPLVAFFVEEQTSYYQQVEGFVLPFDAARTTARNSRQKTEEIER